MSIFFAAGDASENLKAFRKAREDENSPKFDVAVVRAYEGGKGVYEVSLLNIGSGMAARVEASLWWMDSDLAMWLPSRVEGLSDLLLGLRHRAALRPLGYASPRNGCFGQTFRP